MFGPGKVSEQLNCTADIDSSAGRLLLYVPAGLPKDYMWTENLDHRIYALSHCHCMYPVVMQIPYNYSDFSLLYMQGAIAT